jgi:uncharacterized membrane protein YeaQ/YmgE (transglycosylase-associated protein family)
MDSHHLIVWLIIGLVAGALAGRLVEGGGFGCLLDTVIGLAGAVIGGIIVNQLGFTSFDSGGVLRDIVVSFIGAVILLLVVRLLTPRRKRGGSWQSYMRR